MIHVHVHVQLSWVKVVIKNSVCQVVSSNWYIKVTLDVTSAAMKYSTIYYLESIVLSIWNVECGLWSQLGWHILIVHNAFFLKIATPYLGKNKKKGNNAVFMA